MTATRLVSFSRGSSIKDKEMNIAKTFAVYPTKGFDPRGGFFDAELLTEQKKVRLHYLPVSFFLISALAVSLRCVSYSRNRRVGIRNFPHSNSAILLLGTSRCSLPVHLFFSQWLCSSLYFGLLVDPPLLGLPYLVYISSSLYLYFV